MLKQILIQRTRLILDMLYLERKKEKKNQKL